jgi:hypothetical protein
MFGDNLKSACLPGWLTQVQMCKVQMSTSVESIHNDNCISDANSAADLEQ